MGDLRFWLGFNSVTGIGPARLRALLDFFGDIEQAWRASASDLREAGLDRRSLASLVETRQQLDLDQLLRRLEQSGAHALTWDDSDYPASLRTVSKPFTAPSTLALIRAR